MDDSTRYADPGGTFDVQIPRGWSAEPDPEEGGVEIWGPKEVGTLHLLGFSGDSGEPPDPAEELYAFLDEQGIELEEDEVEDLPLTGDAEMAICEYITQEESDGDAPQDAEESTFWLMGVATGSGTLVFASYSCPAGEEGAERDAVRALLGSLRLRPEGNT